MNDDFTRVRELLGLATGKDNGWYTLRIGELKAMLALAGGDLEQALIWNGPLNSMRRSSVRSARTTTAACKRCCCSVRKKSVSRCST
jgi:hypothetical protein